MQSFLYVFPLSLFVFAIPDAPTCRCIISYQTAGRLPLIGKLVSVASIGNLHARIARWACISSKSRLVFILHAVECRSLYDHTPTDAAGLLPAGFLAIFAQLKQTSGMYTYVCSRQIEPVEHLYMQLYPAIGTRGSAPGRGLS